MESQSYSRQTAKLIARLAELFPEVNGGQMQHCIENMPRLAQRIGTILERDAVFRYGIWQHLPADTPRPFDGARQYLTDREYTLQRFEHLLRDSDCWNDYWWAAGIDEKMTEGLKTRWEKLPFAAERLIKIPIVHFPQRPSPHVFEGTMECSIEAAARILLRNARGIAPGQRVLFFCRLRGSDGLHDGSHFCITTAWNGDATLSVVHEVHVEDYTHVVFAERPL